MTNDDSAADDAERCILSALLTGEPKAAEAVLSKNLRPADFRSDSCARVYAAALAVHRRGRVIDPITITDELRATGWRGEDVKRFLGELLDAAPTAANVSSHAEVVIEAARQQSLADLLERAALLLRQGNARLEEVWSSTERAGLLLARRSRDRFRLWSVQELTEQQSPVALIDGVAFANSLVLVVGRYSTMKTFVMLDFALSIAHGVRWQGRRVRPGGVVYVYAEGARGIPPRVDAWKAASGCKGEADIRFVTTAVRMNDPQQVGSLIADIRATGIHPVAVFIDTLARNMDGDEQQTVDMNAFIRGCDDIREAFGATVFVAHHTGWDAKRSRGSSALPGAVDTEIVIARNDLSLTLKCTKQKDGAEFSPIALKAFEIGGSLALRSVGPIDPALTPSALQALKAVQARDGLTATEWLEASELAKATFYHVRPRLLASGYVRTANGKYRATTAGRRAAGTTSSLGPNRGTTAEASEVQHRLTPSGVSVVPDPRDRASTDGYPEGQVR